MVAGKIILENGEQIGIWLTPSEVQKLEYQVKLQKEFYRKEGMVEDYRMVDDLAYGMQMYLSSLPDPEKETPAEKAAGESMDK